jgi:hypothetical protein
LAQDTKSIQGCAHNHPKVFDIPTFLRGWQHDLGFVQFGALPAYTRLLGLHNLHTSKLQFEAAITALVKTATQEPVLKTTKVAAEVAGALADDVLAPLLAFDKETALKNVKHVAEIIHVAILQDPVAALGERHGSRSAAEMALDALEHLLDQAMLPVWKHERNSPERGQDVFDAYLSLHRLHRDLPSETRSLLDKRFWTLMPKIGGWPERGRRLEAKGWKATVRFSADGKQYDHTGEVIDLCPKGQGCHVRFDPPVKRCGTASNDAIELQDNNGSRPIRDVLIQLAAPKETTAFCKAEALRGWMYPSKDVSLPEMPGAAFKISELPSGFCERRVNHLPPRTSEDPISLADLTVSSENTGESTLPGAPGPAFSDGPEGIIQSLRDFFLEFSRKVTQGLWKALRATGRPIDESSLDSIIRPEMEKFVISRAGYIAFQPEIGMGKCDYVIARANDRVIVELKPSYGNWKQGIRKELPAYVKAQSQNGYSTNGLFLVLAFDKKFRRNSNEVHRLLRLRDDACLDCTSAIEVVIIDCDKPVPPSKIRDDGDPSQYYPYKNDLQADSGLGP